MYHRIGTKQSDDIVCARFPDEPEWMGHADISDCGNYVLMTINNSCEPVNQLWYYDLRKSEVEGQGELTADLPWIKLVENFKAKYSCVANHGSKFIFKTNLGAQNYKLVSIDLSEGEKPEWKELMAESENVLQYVAAVNKTKLLVNYMRDCKDELYLYDLETGKQLKKFALEIGTILELSCRKKDDSFFFKFGSFTTPGDIYSFQFDSNNDSHGVKTEPILYKRSEFKGLDLSVFKTEQVFFDSKDGTKVPMFIVSKKEAHKSADTPAFLYAYGGFNISLTPTFSVIRLIWLQHLNGIYVCANIRGGGEYGEKWYDAGRLENKQNCFDDFIAAGDFLTENKYTSKEKLVINGGSNGGLLVTAVINQRPDLCQLAIADVAVCDMLRFHKFTIGAYWVSDFGCADNVKQFKDMIKYSPLHTVKKDTTYPYVLLATADHDDRVVPSHSFKYISELQHHNGHTSRPYLIRIDKKSGHGAGKPTTKIIEEFGDKYAYIAHVLGLKWQD
jgi:prolyl oligopeptidase